MTVTPPADTDTDTTTDTAAPNRWAYMMLIWATISVGAVTFAMSFHGLFDLLRRVAKLPVPLAVLGPLGVDGLTLCAIAATFLLRGAPARVRAYVWLVFGVATGLSVAGNLVDAQVRKLSAAGVVAAAAAPTLLALASHLVVVARRWVERLAAVTAPVTAGPVGDDVEDDATNDEPDMDEPTADDTAPRRALTPKQLRAIARRRYAAGVPCAQIAVDLTAKGHDTSARTVERWTDDIRAARRPAADPPRINGAMPELQPATEGASS